MVGKIALEEAFSLPRLKEQTRSWAGLFAVDANKHANEMNDIEDIRLKYMDQYDVEHKILSFTAPGVQDKYDPKEAQDLAVEVNDYIAPLVQKYPKKYSAFA